MIAGRWTFQKHHAGFDWLEYFAGFYRPLAERNIAMDILSNRANLDGFRLVIAAPHLIDEQIAGELARFVEAGGHLVLGVRSGFKNNDNSLWQQRQPALLQLLAGVHVDEYYALREPIPVSPRPNREREGCAKVRDKRWPAQPACGPNGWFRTKARRCWRRMAHATATSTGRLR